MKPVITLVRPESSGQSDLDRILVTGGYFNLKNAFDLDVAGEGTDTFHILVSADTEKYLQLCRDYSTKLSCQSSALCEKEIAVLAPYLEKFGSETYPDADIYVVCALYRGAAFTSDPVIWVPPIEGYLDQKLFTLEGGGHYTPITDKEDLVAEVNAQSSKLYKELELTKPILLGFNLDDFGNPILADVIPNFGLTKPSLLPTILEFNNVDLNEFLVDVYKIKNPGITTQELLARKMN